jgi:hypothetical protein
MKSNRPTISQGEFDRIEDEARAPDGTEWCFDPALTSDRMRLFWNDPYVGEIGGAYPDGSWWVGDRFFDGNTASGKTSDLLSAMGQVLEAAKAIGALDTTKARRA